MFINKPSFYAIHSQKKCLCKIEWVRGVNLNIIWIVELKIRWTRLFNQKVLELFFIMLFFIIIWPICKCSLSTFSNRWHAFFFSVQSRVVGRAATRRHTPARTHSSILHVETEAVGCGSSGPTTAVSPSPSATRTATPSGPSTVWARGRCTWSRPGVRALPFATCPWTARYLGIRALARLSTWRCTTHASTVSWYTSQCQCYPISWKITKIAKWPLIYHVFAKPI